MSATYYEYFRSEIASLLFAGWLGYSLWQKSEIPLVNTHGSAGSRSYRAATVKERVLPPGICHTREGGGINDEQPSYRRSYSLPRLRQ